MHDTTQDISFRDVFPQERLTVRTAAGTHLEDIQNAVLGAVAVLEREGIDSRETVVSDFFRRTLKTAVTAKALPPDPERGVLCEVSWRRPPPQHAVRVREAFEEAVAEYGTIVDPPQQGHSL